MSYNDVKFSSGTRFLVTGAAGFIGSNLVEALLQMGCEVRGLDNYSTGKKENIEHFLSKDLFEMLEGDIRDIDTCTKACDGVDYVLHQAALGSVPRSVEHPMLYNEVNIGGTLNMMCAARDAGVKRFVYASSSSVYGSSQGLPKVEGEEGELLSPYAVTKKVNEMYAALYYHLYKLPTIGLRYFNVFGRRQDPHSAYAAVMPAFVKKLLKDEAPTINGDGGQSRDFTYIENVIEANLKACTAPENACGEAYNIAYGSSTRLNELYLRLRKLLNKDVEPHYGPERAGDIRHSLADISKAKSMLGYEPSYDINTGLEQSMEWYRQYLG